MTGARLLGLAAVAGIAAVPALPLGPAREYIWHVIIQILLWSFIGGAWSLNASMPASANFRNSTPACFA